MLKQNFRRIIFGVVLLFLIYITIKPLFRSGYYPMHDDIQPMRLMQMDKCIRDLQIPCRWVPDMGYGYGYPQFNYYAPLPYYVMEVIHLSGFGILDSIKIYLIFITLLSVWGVYKASSKFWSDESAGFITAILYTYFPYRAVNLYVRGGISEYTAQALIPFVIYYAISLTKDGKKSDILKLSLSTTALFLSHNISALFILPYLIIFIIYLAGTKNIKNLYHSFARIAVSVSVALFLSAFFLLPALFEKSFVHTETLTSNYFDYKGHFLSIYQILFSNGWGYGSSGPGVNDQIMLGVGLIFWLIPLIALISGFKDKTKRGKLLILNLLAWLSLFLIHPRSLVVWEILPFMKYIQFPWRFNLFAGIFFAIAAGYFGTLKIGKFGKSLIVAIFSILLITMYGSFFRPDKWINISDSEKLSGKNWETAQTVSINDYLPVYTELSPAKKAGDTPQILSGSVTFTVIEKGTNWQRWKIETHQDSRVLAQLFYFPEWKVYVDGREVDYDYKKTNGLIAFDLKQGNREVIIKLVDTPIRIIGNTLSLVSVFLVIYFYKKYKYEE